MDCHYFDCSAGEPNLDSKSSIPSEQAPEISLWEKLGKAAMLDIESSSFSWDRLSSLHHTEHSSSFEQTEDDTGKPLEVFRLYMGEAFSNACSVFLLGCTPLPCL